MTIDKTIQNTSKYVAIDTGKISTMLKENSEYIDQFFVLKEIHHITDVPKLKLELVELIQNEKITRDKMNEYFRSSESHISKLKRTMNNLKELEHIIYIQNLADETPYKINNGLIKKSVHKNILGVLNDYTINLNELAKNYNSVNTKQGIELSIEALNKNAITLEETRDIEQNHILLNSIIEQAEHINSYLESLVTNKKTYANELLAHIKDDHKEIEYSLLFRTRSTTRYIDYKVLDPKPEPIIQSKSTNITIPQPVFDLVSKNTQRESINDPVTVAEKILKRLKLKCKELWKEYNRYYDNNQK